MKDHYFCLHIVNRDRLFLDRSRWSSFSTTHFCYNDDISPGVIKHPMQMSLDSICCSDVRCVKVFLI